MADLRPLFSKLEQSYSAGDFAAADAALSHILQTSPDNVEAIVWLGIISARKGDRRAAIAHLQDAIDLDSQCYSAHFAISTLLFADGQAERAISHGEAAIALEPNDPESYRHLARDLIAHGATERAIFYLREGLRVAPRNPALIQDLASALTEVGYLEESMKAWKQLTELHPNRIIGWIKLGGMYLASRRYNDALACGEAAIALDPVSVDARIVTGLALLGSDGASEALKHLKRAIKFSPNEMVAHSAYGLALHEIGKFDEARPHLEKSLELRPSHGQGYYSLFRTRKVREEDRPMIEKINLHLSDSDASILDRSYMHYALGKAYEDLASYELSMGNYDSATALAAEAWFNNRPPDRERYSEIIQSTIDTFGPEMFDSRKDFQVDSSKPLLVIGMMRSGTTLVEQILSTHPDVKGAGELSYWHDVAGQVFDVRARTIDEVGLKALAQDYLELLEKLGPDSARVTDKMPHNYAMIGFILAALPNARVIYVKRNAVDNCLSIYTTAYQRPPAFTLSKSNIVFGYREHERIMAHWKSVLPSHQLLEVDYEDLIADSEATTRKMIDFAGLEWDDACLHHERNDRQVNTPSVWQVRQPIYKTSVERWRKFEPWLGEFRELLNG